MEWLRVWQTGPTRLDDEHTPERLRDSIQGMRLDNPDVGFEYLDDNEQRAWVVEHMTPEVVSLYDGLPSNVLTRGFDCRSTNSSMSFSVKGMSTPTADLASGETAVRSCIVAAITQPKLMISPGKSVSVSW